MLINQLPKCDFASFRIIAKTVYLHVAELAMEDTTTNDHTDANIRILTAREHILKRPFMYVGGKGFPGYLSMIAYVLEDLLEAHEEEVLIEAEFYPGNRTVLKLKGITLPHLEEYLVAFLEGDPVNSEKFGLGIPVLCTLSALIEIRISHADKSFVFNGKNGVLETAVAPADQQEGMDIYFTCDTEIFGQFDVDYNAMNLLFRKFAFLTPSLKVISTDLMSDELQRNVYHFPKGIFDEMDQQVAQLKYGGLAMRLDIEGESGAYKYQVSIAYVQLWPESTFIKTYAAFTETIWGGSLEQGVLDGLLLAFRESFAAKEPELKLTKKKLKKQLLVIAAVQGSKLVFTGSIKAALGMPRIRKDVKALVSEKVKAHLAANPGVTDELLEIFIY